MPISRSRGMVIAKTIKLKSRGETDIIDITDKITACLQDSGLKKGLVTVFVPGSTGALPPLSTNRA